MWQSALPSGLNMVTTLKTLIAARREQTVSILKEMNLKTVKSGRGRTLAIAAVMGLASVAGTQFSAAAQTAVSAASEVSPLTQGEIRKVDKENGKLTIRHGELTNLGMPAMTMVFQVTERAMLERVAVGDTVRFVADKVAGAYTVTRIEKQ